MMKNLKLFSGTVLGVLTICFAQAQKLPNVQQAGLRAPAQIKVDGRTTEWNNQLQAYNKATGVYYTLCNDDDNLYLAIQAKDPVIIRKILGGSIVFTANRSVKKVDEHVALTFPLLAGSTSVDIGNYLKQRLFLMPGKTNNIYGRDSLLMLMNTTLINNLKQIKVRGVKSLTDSILSIYNEVGIKVRALFDTDNALTCELSIPIKYLELAGVSPA